MPGLAEPSLGSDRGFCLLRSSLVWRTGQAAQGRRRLCINAFRGRYEALLSRPHSADCSGRNPTVFYELGIAHTIGKPTILLTRDSKDVPVDIRYLKYILYPFTTRGMLQLESMLSETIASLGIRPKGDA